MLLFCNGHPPQQSNGFSSGGGDSRICPRVMHLMQPPEGNPVHPFCHLVRWQNLPAGQPGSCQTLCSPMRV